MITIRFFARLRETMGCDHIQMTLAQPVSVDLLRERLARQHPNWAQVIRAPWVLCSVNHAMAQCDSEVCDGDEVAFFPPVTGG
jgi:molybdopterin synthase sulfur carrier subunit